MSAHSLYGLAIRSSLPIPGLPETQGYRAPDVELIWGLLPEGSDDGAERRHMFPPSHQDTYRNRGLKASSLTHTGHVCFRYADGIQFAIDEKATKVWAFWPETLSERDAAVNLLGPVFGFLLRMRGTLCLHASGVAVDGRGLAIVGPHGAGKSTLAAFFAEAGHPVLSDDVLPLVPDAGEFLIQPGYPRLRLWPDSVDALFGAPDALPQITSNWDKRHLDLSDARYRFQSTPLPLGAIYFLGDRTDDTNRPLIKHISPREAFVSLVTNTYANYLLDTRMREEEFWQLTSLLRNVPVRRIEPHADAGRLGELRQAILRDFECCREMAAFAQPV